ncbi:MAG: type II toxin-antitoxin system HicB family antitoxin [Candidatus Brocadiales bacterium]|nr:type II toxin-antitoxin system HicB family antitoxin [Candidatus Brocadiales bacterium]
MTIKNDHYTYRVTWSEEDKEYIGLCVEFPSLSWLAETPEAALKGIREVVSDVIRDLKKNREEIPMPIANKKFSGKFMVRVPPEVHRHLALEAAEAGVSLNRIASTKLTK